MTVRLLDSRLACRVGSLLPQGECCGALRSDRIGKKCICQASWPWPKRCVCVCARGAGGHKSRMVTDACHFVAVSLSRPCHPPSFVQRWTRTWMLTGKWASLAFPKSLRFCFVLFFPYCLVVVFCFPPPVVIKRTYDRFYILCVSNNFCLLILDSKTLLSEWPYYFHNTNLL